MTSDPHEVNDLANDPQYSEILEDMKDRLSSLVNVSQINAQAFQDQREKIEAFGGRQAILEGEELGYTPAPAERKADAIPADKYEP